MPLLPFRQRQFRMIWPTPAAPRAGARSVAMAVSCTPVPVRSQMVMSAADRPAGGRARNDLAQFGEVARRPATSPAAMA